jgi:hypothetical protein
MSTSVTYNDCEYIDRDGRRSFRNYTESIGVVESADLISFQNAKISKSSAVALLRGYRDSKKFNQLKIESVWQWGCLIVKLTILT